MHESREIKVSAGEHQELFDAVGKALTDFALRLLLKQLQLCHRTTWRSLKTHLCSQIQKEGSGVLAKCWRNSSLGLWFLIFIWLYLPSRDRRACSPDLGALNLLTFIYLIKSFAFALVKERNVNAIANAPAFCWPGTFAISQPALEMTEGPPAS